MDNFRALVLVFLLSSVQINADSGSSHGCGGPGTLNTNNGLITSQAGYHYNNNLDCTWRIQAPVGKVIRLTSTSFDVENDQGCNYDFLNVYDGRGIGAKLLGTFCGHNTVNLVSSGQNMFLEFITDDSERHRGFELNYRFVTSTDTCGGQDFQCQNHKCVPHDYICDGDNDCGDNSDERNCQTGGSNTCASDEFRCTDGSCIPDSWRCDIDNDCGDNSDERNCGMVSTINSASGCGSRTLQNGTSGSFSSLNYPHNYGNNLNCRWEINVPTGMHIKLVFSDKYGLEYSSSCEYDRVIIYNGNAMTQVGRYCGSQHPAQMILPSSHAVVTFVSDQSDADMGFLIHWSATSQSPSTPSPSGTGGGSTSSGPVVCGQNFYLNSTTTTGVITSPNFGRNHLYPANAGCVWKFFAPFGYAIRLHFNQFGVEAARQCRYDAVTIIDGQSSSGREIAKDCGNTNPPDAVSKGNAMYVSFVTDGDSQDIGFNATYSIEKIQVSSATVLTDAACHGSTPLNLNGTTGVILSEGYPSGNPYPDNLNCKWKIHAPPGKVITLNFVSFDVEKEESCSYDYLAIYDGNLVSSPLLKTLCGINYPQTLTSTGSDLYIRFHSDDSDSASGFNITYTIHDPIPACTNTQFRCKDGKCINSSAVCNHQNDCSDGGDEALCSSNCGHPRIRPLVSQSKIVGGQESKDGSWPWQVSLRFGHYHDHMCGGTLVNHQWVVTAAHCFEDDKTPKKWTVALGKHSLLSKNSHEVDVGVSKIIVHENYDEDTTENDITLMKLASPVTFTDYIDQICLPKHHIGAGVNCYATGFGDTMGTGSTDLLKQVLLPVINVNLCNSTRYLDGEVFSTNICAGYDEGGRDTCQGDSGGPLVCEEGDLWYLQGITSWGIGCADKRSPGVYTDVISYLPWIRQTLAANI